eukprot:6701210-Alexandrium_andersonii.AAC.1
MARAFTRIRTRDRHHARTLNANMLHDTRLKGGGGFGVETELGDRNWDAGEEMQGLARLRRGRQREMGMRTATQVQDTLVCTCTCAC